MHFSKRATTVESAHADLSSLRALGTAILTELGLPATDAALVADSLVQGDLWGHSSHGVLRLPDCVVHFARRIPRAEALIAELKRTPLAPGNTEILYPGELEARNDTRLDAMA